MIHPKFLAAALAVSFLFFMSCSSDDDAGADTDGEVTAPAGMVLIDAGGNSFQMGSESVWDGIPVHTVSFANDFWMDTTEITQSDYETVMAAYYANYITPTWTEQYGLGDNRAAYYVSWSDAILYCNARSRRDGLDTVYTYTSISGSPGSWCEVEGVAIDYTRSGYRLPTEAEWEYACRAGSTADYYWGKDYDPYPSNAADSVEVSAHAVWYSNSWELGADNADFGVHQVATKEPNAFGLYDVTGNLLEYCNDWYGEYASTAVTDPAGASGGDRRTVRGGCWGSTVDYLLSGTRTFLLPNYEYYFVGFRTVRPAR